MREGEAEDQAENDFMNAAAWIAGGRSAPALELSPIKAIELAASRLPDVVSLAQGIPSFDTPEPIKRFIAQKMEEGACARYSLSPGLPELRELISESLLEEGMRYDPDGEILVTCGAIEAISATMLALLREGDEVLLASPSYASYVPAIRISGATPRFFALNEEANFDLDTDAIEAAITRRTRAILLSNPNNPTGTVYSPAETERMMELAERHDLLVITDDVYKDFLYTNEPVGNPAKLAAHRERVIRVCSFSKAYGMTGWRVGFLHTTRELATSILAVHDALVTCAPVASQYGAIAALQQGDESLQQFRAEFRQRRTRIIERLDALPQIFDYQTPNASYFAFPRIKDTVPLARDSRALALDILERARVALVPGVAFGPSGESHLRFCYARAAADIDRAFDRLTDYFGGRTPRTYSLPLAEPAAEPVPRRRVVAQWVFRELARSYLKRTRPKIVAIAGGRGKTVLKRTLTDLLRREWRVRSNPLSYNTPIGLALSVLDTTFNTRDLGSVGRGIGRAVHHGLLGAPVDVLILELGVRRPGDIAHLLEIVVPDVAVITPLSAASADDPDALAVLHAEMQALARSVSQRSATLLLCGDDSSLADIVAGTRASQFTLEDVQHDECGWKLVTDGREQPIGRELVGDTSRQAIAASVRVAQALGMESQRIERWLSARDWECFA